MQMENSTQLAIGSIVRDNYEIVGVLGNGGMASVFKAKNLAWETKHNYVALKVLNEELFSDEKQIGLFFREYQRTEELRGCEQIINVYEYFKYKRHACIAMEYVDGNPLKNILKKNGSLTLQNALPMIKSVGEALSYAHVHDIVHRDIKPDNILILSDGSKRAKLFDFGVASKINEFTDLTAINGHDVGGGTQSYASPEMLKNPYLRADVRDDVYAFACVIYEALTGEKFYRLILKEAEPEIGAGINKWEWIGTHGKAVYEKILKIPISGLNARQMQALCKGLAFEREARQISAQELAAAFEDNHAATSNKLPPKNILWAVGGITVVATLGGVIWFAMHGAPTSPIVVQPTVSQMPVVAQTPPVKVQPAPVLQPQLAQAQPVPVVVQPAQTATVKSGLSHQGVSADKQLEMAILASDFKLNSDYVLTIKSKYKNIRLFMFDNDKDSKPDELDVMAGNVFEASKVDGFRVFTNKGHLVGKAGTSTTLSVIASDKPIPKDLKITQPDGVMLSEDVKNGGYSTAQIEYTVTP